MKRKSLQRKAVENFWHIAVLSLGSSVTLEILQKNKKLRRSVMGFLFVGAIYHAVSDLRPPIDDE